MRDRCFWERPTLTLIPRVCLFATLLGTSGVAAARVAPLVPVLEPERSPEMVRRFQRAVSEGLVAAGHDVIATDVIEKAHAVPCADLDCLGGGGGRGSS